MTKRTPIPPPTLPGFTFVEHIGSGGHADVFLYEEHALSRRVAVKVLDPSTVDGQNGGQAFTSEANLMAKVSAHPYIVQIFGVGIAPQGQPYLLMEYYPGENFYERARNDRLAVDDVLRVGIQVASAVETAHAAGILHRDIKPANILTSEYRRPGLTDFGIASTQGPGDSAADGVSIPWAPPEALGERPLDRRSDVYALGATLFTLLSGRAPFEVSGGDNRSVAMMSRIEHSPLPSIGRADVPASLERLLARAMAKDPAHRPKTAADLARELQAIESEMRLAVTQLELPNDGRSLRPRSGRLDDDDATRLKSIVEIAPHDAGRDSVIGHVPATPPAAVGERRPRRREGLLAEPEVADTVMRPATPPDLQPAPPAGRSRVVIAAAAAVAVVGAVAALAVIVPGGGDDAENSGVEREQEVSDSPIVVGPAPLAEVSGIPNDDGSFTFSWPAREGAVFVVHEDGVDGSQRSSEATFRSSAPCIEVQVLTSDGNMSDPTRGCAA